MNNVKLTLAYDGTVYFGWQKTDNGPSIEESLQTALEKILQHPIKLQATSRTDAGVHAQGQIVNFFTEKPLPPFKLQNALNGLLPPDISVLHAEYASPTFHPTLDCKSKEYHYSICYGPIQLPQHRLYSWHYPHSLNLHNMHLAAQYFLGSHDFAAFCNFKKNEVYDHHIREVTQIKLLPLENQRLLIKISGNNFLYKMVRNIVGTLVYVGAGKIPPENIPNIIEKQDRTLAGITAPACGLKLYQVTQTETIIGD